MEFVDVNAYIDRMPFTERYDALAPEAKEAVVFSASEMLLDEYGEDQVTERAVALQVLFMIEGEAEEFAKLKRHGVKSYSVKGVSVTFEGSGIAPEVVRIMELQNRRPGTGRLI